MEVPSGGHYMLYILKHSIGYLFIYVVSVKFLFFFRELFQFFCFYFQVNFEDEARIKFLRLLGFSKDELQTKVFVVNISYIESGMHYITCLSCNGFI